LVVDKLDRLARNMAFTATLMESGVEFACCDNPHADRPTIHILAAVAEDEASRISERTKAALQAAKTRGVSLGSAREGHWRRHGRSSHAELPAGPGPWKLPARPERRWPPMRTGLREGGLGAAGAVGEAGGPALNLATP
jgi:hypothetical protein